MVPGWSTSVTTVAAAANQHGPVPPARPVYYGLEDLKKGMFAKL